MSINQNNVDNISNIRTDEIDNQLEAYRSLIKTQQESLDKQKLFIETLKNDIDKMLPFFELTKTIKRDDPKLWAHYASKTINNK